MKSKVCKKCNKEKEIWKFSKKINARDGLQSNCKSCVSEYNRRNYNANRESILERSTQWQQNNKEAHRINANNSRAKKFNIEGKITLEQWEESLKWFNYKCAYTGKKLTVDDMTIEHIIPLAEGGSNYIWNVIPVNRSANSSKNTEDIMIWLREQKFWDLDRIAKIDNWRRYAEEKYYEEATIETYRMK